ncbi:hypothetical protein ASF30_18400 [Leifsonia sp. Leaf264]|nr:hypothetical protein ASF30_18400 [Leifsonia sp. Leaf264]
MATSICSRPSRSWTSSGESDVTSVMPMAPLTFTSTVEPDRDSASRSIRVATSAHRIRSDVVNWFGSRVWRRVSHFDWIACA